MKYNKINNNKSKIQNNFIVEKHYIKKSAQINNKYKKN